MNHTVNGVRVRSKHGACGHRGTAATSSAHQPTVAQAPLAAVLTGRTREARWPPQPLQVVQVVQTVQTVPHRYRTKPGTRPPILGSACRLEAGPPSPSHHSRTPTPVKWIPQYRTYRVPSRLWVTIQQVVNFGVAVYHVILVKSRSAGKCLYDLGAGTWLVYEDRCTP